MNLTITDLCKHRSKQCGSRSGLALLVQENSKTSWQMTFVVIGALSVNILSSYMDFNLIFLINICINHMLPTPPFVRDVRVNVWGTRGSGLMS